MKASLKYTLAFMMLLCGAMTVQAQVKIGSNPTTIESNSNLEVEAVTGSKVVVTKDSSKIGVGTATPTAKLELNSGQTDRSGFRFTQLKSTSADQMGTLANLTVDENGYVGKSSSPAYKLIAVTGNGGTAASLGGPSALTTLINIDNTAYTVSGGDIVVAQAGVYQITARVLFTTISSAITYALDIYVNGGQAERLATDSAPAIVSNCVVGGTTVLSLPAGAVITYKASVSAPFSAAFGTGKMIIERLK